MSMMRLAQAESYYPTYQAGNTLVTGVEVKITALSDNDWWDWTAGAFQAVPSDPSDAMTSGGNGFWYHAAWAVPNLDEVYQVQFEVTDPSGTYYALGPMIVCDDTYIGGGGSGTADWTTGEKEQIRDALGVDGDKTTAVSGQLQIIDSNIDSILQDTGTTLHDALGTVDALVDTLVGRLTAARAGYLDNLNGHTPQTGDTYAELPSGFSNLVVNPNGYVESSLVRVKGLTTTVDNIEDDYDGTGYNKANSEIGTAAALTGHTAQTGDNYARLGAPAGASVSADILGISGVTDNIPDSGALTALIAQITAVKAVTDALTSASAALLAASAGTMVEGTVSHDNTAASTTVFYCDDITEATADHYIGRVVIFTSGALQYQATDITDYALVSGEGQFTVTALTEAPADNVTFIII